MFGANSAAVVFVQAELCAISCENSPIFVTMATRVDPMKIIKIRQSYMDFKFSVFGSKWVCDLEKSVKVAESGSVYLGPLGIHTCIYVMFVR